MHAFTVISSALDLEPLMLIFDTDSIANFDTPSNLDPLAERISLDM